MRTTGKCNNSHAPPPPSTGLSGSLHSARTQFSWRIRIRKKYQRNHQQLYQSKIRPNYVVKTLPNLFNETSQDRGIILVTPKWVRCQSLIIPGWNTLKRSFQSCWIYPNLPILGYLSSLLTPKRCHWKSKSINPVQTACADPEKFVRGGTNLITLILVDEGIQDPNTITNRPS